VTEVSNRIVTIPNALSLLRLLLIPVFLGTLIAAEYIWALVILVVSSVTDLVDGVVARRFDQITRLGQLLDPAADRLYILATLIGLAWQQFIPWWLVAIIIARDVMLIILGVVLANHGYGPLYVHHLGKMATFALLFALPVLILGGAFAALEPVATVLGWSAALWGAFLYWWAGILYLRETIRVVRISPGSGPSASDSLNA
tara:strand:- start:5207 stop:5809 length:603 start_codon:yes stop_codon:yes gene_type:complete